MEYLFSQWDKVKTKLFNRRIALFLDYDGTLTPIVKTPEKAVISRENRRILEKVAGCPGFSVAVISGRALDDIKKLVGIKGIVYCGNHGFEIEGPGIKFSKAVGRKCKASLGRIRDGLKKRLSGIRGVYVEDKGPTLSIHYRLVSKKSQPLVAMLFKSAVKLYAAGRKIRITAGKKVFEVRPYSEWNKGKIMLRLLARQRFISKKSRPFAVYIGDDATDEDAFKALEARGLTVFVGRPRPSYADYYLKDTKEVYKFLKMLLQLAKGTYPCQSR